MRWIALGVGVACGCVAPGEPAPIGDDPTGDASAGSSASQESGTSGAETGGAGPPTDPRPDDPPIGPGTPDDGAGSTTDAPDVPPPCDEIFSVVDAPALPHSSPALEYSPGSAWADVDADGWVEAVVTDHGGPNRMLRRDADGSLAIAAAGAWALPGASNGGVTFADYDNDGWPDLYVSIQDGPNALLRNLDGRGFADVTADAGVGDPGRGIGSAWADYDGDGRLDLYSVSWNDPLLVGSGTLYHNAGDGSFTDRTDLLGLDQTSRPAFAAAWLDHDDDGDLDLYVVVDRNRGNVLWRNDGPGCGGWCFTDVSVEAGVDQKISGMGVAVGDYDGDLDLDLYFTHGGRQYLMQNQIAQGDPVFVDVSFEAGVSPPTVGWGAAFLDYDNDGWLDLYLANGPWYGIQRNHVFRNLGDGTFEDASDGSGADDLGRSYSVATADFDRDGSVDLMVGNRDQAYVLYRNCALAADHGWLSVSLVGGGPINRDAIGARVFVTTTDGRVQMQEAARGSSIGSSHSPRLHFGLGRASLDHVLVRWPDGTETAVDDPRPGELEIAYAD